MLCVLPLSREGGREGGLHEHTVLSSCMLLYPSTANPLRCSLISVKPFPLFKVGYKTLVLSGDALNNKRKDRLVAEPSWGIQ